jgi:hypothetical protein
MYWYWAKQSSALPAPGLGFRSHQTIQKRSFFLRNKGAVKKTHLKHSSNHVTRYDLGALSSELTQSGVCASRRKDRGLRFFLLLGWNCFGHKELPGNEVLTESSTLAGPGVARQVFGGGIKASPRREGAGAASCGRKLTHLFAAQASPKNVATIVY